MDIMDSVGVLMIPKTEQSNVISYLPALTKPNRLDRPQNPLIRITLTIHITSTAPIELDSHCCVEFNIADSISPKLY